MAAQVQYKKADFLAAATLDYGFVKVAPYGEAVLLMFDSFLVGFSFVRARREETLDEMLLLLKPKGVVLAQKKADAMGKKINARAGAGAGVPMLMTGTDFYHQVWRALLKVPLGKTLTYGGLAKKIGNPKAARAVGNALNKNKIGWLVPCHRVLAGDGTLHGFRGGLAMKEKLLKNEGASFRK